MKLNENVCIGWIFAEFKISLKLLKTLSGKKKHRDKSPFRALQIGKIWISEKNHFPMVIFAKKYVIQKYSNIR